MKKETAYQRRGCSIFCKILRSLLLVLLAEVLLLIFAISTSRVTSQLNENAEDILDKQVENRANYLRQNLIQAQDLNAISGTVDRVTRELVDQGIVDLNTLDTSSEEALPLLQAIVPELVSTLRTKPVNGIFVILSTHDLNHRPMTLSARPLHPRPGPQCSFHRPERRPAGQNGPRNSVCPAGHLHG